MASSRQSILGNVMQGVKGRIRKVLKQEKNKAGLTWLKIKKLKHLPYNSPHTYSLNGTTIHFNNGPELLHSLKEIFVEEVYRISFNTKAPYIIDCGANIGLAVLYLKWAYPEAKLIAFEPDPANFSLLQKNIARAGFTNVDLRNEAIWKEDTTLQFSGDATLGSKIESSGISKNTISVKAARLKPLLQTHVDFLKMDIEGAEYEVLKDCGDSLRNIQYLFIEYHGFFNKINELTEVLDLVTGNGFAYYIREATTVYPTPFYREGQAPYDLQLNIFCFRQL